jgi:hypothetical protein
MWITGQGAGFGLRPKQRFAEHVVGIYHVWIARSRRAEGAAKPRIVEVCRSLKLQR